MTANYNDPIQKQQGDRQPRAARVNLRVLLVVAITGLVFLTVLTVSLLHSAQFKRHAHAEADRALTSAADTLKVKVEALLAPATVIAGHLRSLPLDEVAAWHPKERSQEFARFFDAVEIIPAFNEQIYGAYLGYPDGSFAMIVRNSPGLLDVAGLPPDISSPYLRIERDIPASVPVDRWSNRDSGTWQSVVRPTLDYDPRSRPWYRLGANSDTPVWTSLYRFFVEDGFGITLASGLRDHHGELRAILGIDLRLDDLTRFIRSLDISERGLAFIADDRGGLIAHPSMTASIVNADIDAGPPTLYQIQDSSRIDASVFDAFHATGDKAVTVQLDGETVLGRRVSLDASFGFEAALYVAAPLADFTAAADTMAQRTLMLTALLTLLVLVVGMLIARAVAKPIRQAVSDMEAIARLDDLEPSTARRSMLLEIDKLNASVDLMKSALNCFGRYVPRELVRDLVEMRQPLELGGSRREITVMFTDIEGFTSLTETEQHEQLVDGLADYFEIVCRAISDRGGVVDKFIGDAVMAIWGAPMNDPDHTSQACQAVSQIMRELESFNASREARGLPPFKTRFGLHRGYAFVGNVGARDRFSYTALGDVVNTAARLETANRDLGTQCLVSRAVVAHAGDALPFESVGEVQLIGKYASVEAFSMVQAGASERSEPAERQVDAEEMSDQPGFDYRVDACLA